jgi:hypothetical protein
MGDLGYWVGMSWTREWGSQGIQGKVTRAGLGNRVGLGLRGRG